MAVGDERERLLDPVDRICETIFGLVMAVTIVGSLSVATAGEAEMRTVSIAALGCNLAWGLVDAVMNMMRTVAERSRLRELGLRIRREDPATGQRLLRDELPDVLRELVDARDIERMRERLLARPLQQGVLLGPRDFLEAVGIFALVVLATFPVVIPFFVMDTAAGAVRAAQIVAVAMLFGLGIALGRYAGHARPWVTGAAMALFGGLLTVIVMALGG